MSLVGPLPLVDRLCPLFFFRTVTLTDEVTGNINRALYARMTYSLALKEALHILRWYIYSGCIITPGWKISIISDTIQGIHVGRLCANSLPIMLAMEDMMMTKHFCNSADWANKLSSIYLTSTHQSKVETKLDSLGHPLGVQYM